MAEPDNQGFREQIERENGGNQWTIELHAYEVFDTPVTDPIVHFEIVFVYPSGEVFNVINGDPFEKGTGRHAGDLSAADDDNVLKVNYGSDVSFGDRTGKEPLTAFKLWQGETSEFYEHLFRAREAGAVINSLDIDYVIIAPFRDAQNSNSVVGTVVKATGLEISSEAQSIWAPGSDRNLLPNDFKSYFDFFPVTNENFAEFFSHVLDPNVRAGIHNAYTDAIFSPLNRGNVVESAKQLSKPEEDEALKMFDPNEARTPEQFGQSAAHTFMHDNDMIHHHGNSDFKHSH